MYLRSLEIAGFKSFAKKATLSFNTAITGIVGPNGSGKSNVAEAFRFVLGEQSIKSLRGKRGEDLIWNGGGDSGRGNRASAKLVFDNTRRIFPSIDFDEVSIERVVNRDNSNEYFLNGSQVRLKDVMELLGSAHVGSTGHHIISQGEADRILSASIRERREMVEDALGLKVYQWKKAESLRKLERTEENMKQVESLRREIAPHIKFLKKQVEKIEKAREMRQELVALYKDYFSHEEQYLSHEHAHLTALLVEPTRELSTLEKELEKAKAILTASKGKDAKSTELVDIESRLARIRADKDTIVRDLGRIEGEIGAYTRAIEREKDKQKRDEFKTVYLKDVEEAIDAVEKMSAIGEVISFLKQFIKKHRVTNDSSAIGEAEKEIQARTHEKSIQESKLKALGHSEEKLLREYDELKKNIEKEKDTNRDAEKDVFRIIARQNEVRGVISKHSGLLAQITHEQDVLKREMGEAGIMLGRDVLDYPKLEGSSHVARDIQENKKKQIERTKIRLEDAGLGGSSEVLKEYTETEERDTFLVRELADLEKAKQELRKLVADLDARIDYEFKTGILKINTEFNNFFGLMFGGGKAELSVVKEVKRKKKTDAQELSEALNPDMNDMESESSSIEGSEDAEQGPEGLEVSVNLPRKKVKSLMMLSGGERALTSIALLFAISQVNPPPFIILDETDAALDEANSKKYGDMIEQLAKNSQLILITHNRETMSRAGIIYGVTMGSDGASKLLSINFEEAAKVAK